jgi:hypothetical protein
MVSRNDQDVRLLYNDPRGLLEKYQSTIGFIVQKFVATGFFHPSEKADVIQSINERLWRDKIRNMQAQYNHAAGVGTYFSKVVHNLCVELRRQSNRERLIDRARDFAALDVGYEDNSGLRNVVIAGEVKRFETILKLFGKCRAKLELSLKLFFRMEIKEGDVRRYCPHCRAEEVKSLLAHFDADYESMPDKEIYAIVTPIFNRCEGKASSPDALRKWINTKVDEIIEWLNGRTRSSNYDQETLKILVQKYYESQEEALEMDKKSQQKIPFCAPLVVYTDWEDS